MKRAIIAVFAFICCFLMTLPIGQGALAAEVAAEQYDAYLTFETVLSGNGSFYRAFRLAFRDGVAYSTQTAEDGSEKFVVNENLSRLTTELKQELRIRYGTHYDVTVSEKGNIEIIEFFEDGYTEFYSTYGIDGYYYEESDRTVKNGFLFNTYIDEDTTVFSKADNPFPILEGDGDLFRTTNLTEIANSIVSADKILRIYNYGTKYRRSITSTADVVGFNKAGNYLLHSFYITPDNLERTYSLTTKSPNSGVWYLLAAAVGGIISVATLTVIGIRKKHNDGVYYG